MGSESDTAAEFLDRFAEAWASNDGAALGEHFTEDGSLVNPFGERADGRAAVADMYREYFRGLLAGTTTKIALETLRPAGEDHALVDAEQSISGASGDVLMAFHLAALLRRDEGEWRFVDSRPYAPAPAPAGAAGLEQ
jgi:uncharacterized protein (TIGR02246 family)